MQDKVTKEYFEKITEGKEVNWKSFNGWEFVEFDSADKTIVYRFIRQSASDEKYGVKELKCRTDIKLA